LILTRLLTLWQTLLSKLRSSKASSNQHSLQKHQKVYQHQREANKRHRPLREAYKTHLVVVVDR
jgi:hypothetical protein